MNKAIVLTNGLFLKINAKTAHGLVRGTEKFEIIGVVDGIETAGKDAGELLDGKKRNIPIFSDVEKAGNALPEINFLIVGVATLGGVFPPDMLEIIRNAIQNKISIVNGLHEYLSEKNRRSQQAEPPRLSAPVQLCLAGHHQHRQYDCTDEARGRCGSAECRERLQGPRLRLS